MQLLGTYYDVRHLLTDSYELEDSTFVTMPVTGSTLIPLCCLATSVAQCKAVTDMVATVKLQVSA